jgi:hypothetical protein
VLDARRAAELREQFIAVLGHDLRNRSRPRQAGGCSSRFSAARPAPGPGKAWAWAHGGTVDVASDDHQTRFTFRMPQRQQAALLA